MRWLSNFIVRNAARIMGKRAHQTHREHVKANARAMREAFGLPPSEALR